MFVHKMQDRRVLESHGVQEEHPEDPEINLSGAGRSAGAARCQDSACVRELGRPRFRMLNTPVSVFADVCEHACAHVFILHMHVYMQVCMHA